MTFSHQTPKDSKPIVFFTQPTTSYLNIKTISCHCHSIKKKKQAIFLGYSQLIRVKIRWDNEIGVTLKIYDIILDWDVFEMI